MIEISKQALVEFLAGVGTDHRGRTIHDIIKWPDSELENSHDYIQWAFPNRAQSRFNPQAPVLDDEIVRQLVDCPAAMANMKRVLFRIYSFYSFEIEYFEDETYQLNLPEYSGKLWWVSVGNHNYLRLTRILLTLRDLGLHDDLFALTDILDVLYRKHSGLIGATTYAYWLGSSAWT